MDLDTYEQPALTADMLGESAQYLKEGLEVKLTYYDSEPIDVELPTSVDLLVTEADIAIRGDTATGVNKKLMTETGLQVQVPSFVEAGNTIRVDTRTGAYVTRV
jgi:elongation factor P